MPFQTLGLIEELTSAIADKGYSQPTPIQEQAIPLILQGKDILGGAQTGTGKTAGFTLPLLQLLSENPTEGKRHVRALILTPTRELAAQVKDSIKTYGKYLPLKSTVVFGGVRISSQISALKKGVDILVATPGRLLDHVSQKTVDLSHVEMFILDEVDQMLDMGFIHDVRKIIGLLPKKRQNLLFSATCSAPIKKLADTLLNSPMRIEVAQENTTSEQVDQLIYSVDRERKPQLLAHLIESQNWKQALVFTRTKHGANRLSEQLNKNGIRADAIHGNKAQGARTKALLNFKKGRVRILVATDIAARGLDIPELPHVVNYELPQVPADYVHRIGRTGRASCEGKAISLVCIDERKLLKDIERFIKQQLPKEVIPGYEPNPSIKPQPIQKRRSPRFGKAGAKKHNTRSSRPGRKGSFRHK